MDLSDPQLCKTRLTESALSGILSITGLTSLMRGGPSGNCAAKCSHEIKGGIQ